MSLVDLVSDVKKSMGITSSDFDYEIQTMIKACFLDLNIAGVKAPKDDNIPRDLSTLHKQAVIYYCKAYLRVDATSPNYIKVFEHLKDAMSLSGEYRDV